MAYINKKFNKRRSKFGLSHSFKFSCDMGNLVPIMCEDVSPGDTFRLNTDAVVRFAPMLAPLMHEIDVYTHYFFVPNRLTWTNWENFITGGERGDDVSVVPTITSPSGGFGVSSLVDYLYGCNVDAEGLTVDAMPARAYQLILNEWYRQQDLQDSRLISFADGPDTTTDLSLYNRNWNKDYFTSCLPFQQKGPAVLLPLSGNAPVIGTAPVSGLGTFAQTFSTNASSAYFTDGTGADPVTTTANWVGSGGSGTSGQGYVIEEDPNNSGFPNIRANADVPTSTLEADLSKVSSATINDLRQSFQLQRWLEANMRCGSRYTESILSHFGVHSPDQRLQRPEFLGGGRSPVVFSEVLQTSETSSTGTPQANMAGHGFGAHRSHQFVKSFPEHGWVIGLMSIVPVSSYSGQGVDRRFTRFSKYDYLWPLFAHLGEQPVLNKEVYAQGFADPAADEGVFGYQPRYQEYRKRRDRDWETKATNNHIY